GIRDFHVTGVQTCALPILPNKIFDFSLTEPGLLFRSFMLVIVSIVGAVVISIFFGRSLLSSRAFKRLVLEDEQNSSKGYVSSVRSEERRVGKEYSCRCARR